MALIRDVAKLAGVSVSTVSRVINESHDVDEHTRANVREAINKLDYKPNLVAKGLRGKRGNLIGLVVPEVMDHAFTSIINYTMDVTHSKGFNIIVGSTHNDPDKEENFIDDLLRRNVNGIIISRVSDESRVLRKIDRTQVPIVIIDRTLDSEGIPSVILHNYNAGLIAARRFVELGHERIGCVTGPLNIALCRERLRGFKEFLSKNRIIFPDQCVYEGDFKFNSGVEAARYFLETNCDLTAIWAQNDIMAFGMLKEVQMNGIKVPDDLSLIGMDNLKFCEMITPSLTTVDYPFKEMSERAVELILMQNDKKEIENKITVLEPSLIERNSTAQLRYNAK